MGDRTERCDFFLSARTSGHCVYFATAGAVSFFPDQPRLEIGNGTYLISLPQEVFFALPHASLERIAWDNTAEVYRWEGQATTRGRIGSGVPCHIDHPDWGSWVL